MVQLAAFIIALAKALPAAARLLDAVVSLYAQWKIQANLSDEKSCNDRNAAAIAAARVRMLPQLCDACPFASHIKGQYRAPPYAPAVSSSGGGST